MLIIKPHPTYSIGSNSYQRVFFEYISFGSDSLCGAIVNQHFIPTGIHKKTGKCVVTLRYTDIDGKEKRRAKRGFLTKREAKEWETEYLSNLSTEVEIDMLLDEFYEVYLSDISNKLRYNTIKNKRIIYDKYIQPYLGEYVAQYAHLKSL